MISFLYTFKLVNFGGNLINRSLKALCLELHLVNNNFILYLTKFLYLYKIPCLLKD